MSGDAAAGLPRRQFRALLADDERTALPFERMPEDERRARRLAPPATNLGSGRGRFRVVLTRLAPLLDDGASLCDLGAYPGTMLRLVRTLSTANVSMTGLGLGFSADFREAMRPLGARLAEVEFDARMPPSGAEHILTCDIEKLGGPFEICTCTEVIEHQVQPVSLLLGLSRLTAVGGTVLLTTNSVSFVGDIAKLLVGRHNVESLERSHVLSDSDWRPHIRLYTLAELRELVQRSGFQVVEARHFDNGNVYAGAKGAATAATRLIAGAVPHLRSHLLIVARRTSEEPDPGLRAHLDGTLAAHAVDVLRIPSADAATS